MISIINTKLAVVSEDITEREFVERTNEFWIVITSTGDLPMETLDLDDLVAKGFVAFLKPDYRVLGLEHIYNVKGTYHIPSQYPHSSEIEYVWSPIRLLVTEHEGEKVEKFDVLLGNTTEFFRGHSRARYGYLMEYRQFENIGFSVAVQLANGVVRVMPWEILGPGIGLDESINFHNIFLPL